MRICQGEKPELTTECEDKSEICFKLTKISMTGGRDISENIEIKKIRYLGKGGLGRGG